MRCRMSRLHYQLDLSLRRHGLPLPSNKHLPAIMPITHEQLSAQHH